MPRKSRRLGAVPKRKQKVRFIYLQIGDEFRIPYQDATFVKLEEMRYPERSDVLCNGRNLTTNTYCHFANDLLVRPLKEISIVIEDVKEVSSADH